MPCRHRQAAAASRSVVPHDPADDAQHGVALPAHCDARVYAGDVALSAAALLTVAAAGLEPFSHRNTCHGHTIMSTADILQCNRVILTHFDSYSAALLFARWDERSLLWPAALPESATPMPAPDDIGPAYAAEAVRQALIERCALNPDELVQVDEFAHWAQTEAGPVRIHLLRFTTPDAPKALVEAHNGSFRHLTQLRGAAMSELLLLREVFNLIVGGSGGRA